MEKAAVTSLCWVPKGKCHIKQLAGGGAAEAAAEERAQAEDGSRAQGSAGGDGLEEFDMDNYDEEEDDAGMQLFSVLKADSHLAREPDPFMNGNPDSDSDSEGFLEIRPEDQVFAAVSCSEDICSLELYVFDDEEASMYVHHETMLSAYPLCVEWLSNAPGGEGSFGAVGLIDHSIQIWDLDDVDPMEPRLSLGPKVKAAKTKKNKKKSAGAGADGPKAHDGPVLCLHSSPFNRSVLASGSGDETVKVWDVGENSVIHTYAHHSNKVQCVRWHPTEQAVLLSASFDRNLGLLDVRQPNQASLTLLPAEAECAMWSRHRPFECLASTDTGFLACFDVRKVVAKAEDKGLVWSIQAHDVACTAVQDSPAPGCLVTCGLDGSARVWNSAGGAKPRQVFEKDLKAGPLFTCQSSLDAPALMCFGGRCPVMWDLTSEEVLVDCFKFEVP